jgi:hypothetical protein
MACSALATWRPSTRSRSARALGCTIVSIELDDELRAVTRRWFEQQEHLKDVVFIELGDITTISSERFRNLCVSIGGIQLFIGACRRQNYLFGRQNS